MNEKYKVGDVVCFHEDSYFLTLVAAYPLPDNTGAYAHEGFFVFAESWRGDKKEYGVFTGWETSLVTNKSIIDHVKKEYFKYQLCEVVEK